MFWPLPSPHSVLFEEGLRRNRVLVAKFSFHCFLHNAALWHEHSRAHLVTTEMHR